MRKGVTKRTDPEGDNVGKLIGRRVSTRVARDLCRLDRIWEWEIGRTAFEPPFANQPQPKAGDIISDGCMNFLVIGDKGLCVPLTCPRHLFRVPPSGFFNNLGPLKNFRNPVEKVIDIIDTMCLFLEELVPEDIKGPMGKKLVCRDIERKLKELATEI